MPTRVPRFRDALQDDLAAQSNHCDLVKLPVNARAASKCSNQTVPSRPHPTSTTSTKSAKTISKLAATNYRSEGSNNLRSALDRSNVRSYTGAVRWEPAPRCWGRTAGILPMGDHS